MCRSRLPQVEGEHAKTLRRLGRTVGLQDRLSAGRVLGKSREVESEILARPKVSGTWLISVPFLAVENPPCSVEVRGCSMDDFMEIGQ